MSANPLSSRRGVLAHGLATAALLAGSGCRSVTLRTLRLTPVRALTGVAGFSGSKGYCLRRGNIPPPAFPFPPSSVQVGYEHYFRGGTAPFACDDFQALDYRAGVLFDLSAFDNVGLATLAFRALETIRRNNGETVGTNPPTSGAATMLAQATEPFSMAMRADNEVTLPSGPAVSLGVGSQVHDWTTRARPNHGFVLWGPLLPPSRSDPPRDNDALVTRYGEFSLTLFFNPALNPRAPA